MLVQELRTTIEQKSSPLSWQRILFRLLPEFKKEGLFFHQIQDNVELSSQLVDKIVDEVFMLYNIEIPRISTPPTNPETDSHDAE
jgi:hypothetical protein